MAEQQEFKLDVNSEPIDSVEQYKFEPIKGYPMLHWKGKRPFRSTQYYPAQLKEKHGKEVDGWFNRIYWGDNLQVMSHLLKEFRGKIDLVYIDPPFDSKADYKKKIEVKGKKTTNDSTFFEEKQYSDIWTNDQYLQFMYERLILLRELLSETGTIFVHCDSKKGHHLRCLLDEIFGPDNFVNEITWHYYNKMAPDSKCFPRASDKIIFFAKNIGTHTFHKQVEKREKPVKQLVRKFVDGKAINVRDENGNVLYRESYYKRVDDVWRIPMLQPADKTENTNYPTQKPEELLERIIKSCTNPGDLVFDCFMGSGTTQAVAMRLGRRFIGADINLGAIQTTTKRLLNLAKNLESQNIQIAIEEKVQDTVIDEDIDDINIQEQITKYYTGFYIYNVNHYDIFRNPLQARELLLEALEIQPLEHNSLYDGEKDGRLVKIMPINRIATRADLNELITNFDYKLFEKRREERPNQPVEKLLLVCMGHEPDLAAALQSEVDYKLDIEIVDILRHKSKLEFKRDSEAKVTIQNKQLIVERFYPMNLLQKLSLLQENVEDWRELVESIMIDWNYDGVVFEPSVVDVPGKNELVKGVYDIPEDAGTIRIKITDLLSESLEVNVQHG